jgi:hypothetical protein
MDKKVTNKPDVARREAAMDILRRLASDPSDALPATIVMWVFRDYDARWCVRREGGKSVNTFARRDDALAHARRLGLEHGSYRMFFQLKDGRITEELFNAGCR